MAENENKKMDIRVEIDPDYIESKNTEIQNLRDENEQLKSDLTIIAEKEFNAKCKKFGLDPANTSPEDLRAKQEEGSTAPLNANQIYNSNSEEGFQSIEGGILTLSEQAKSDPEIKKMLDKTAKRVLKPTIGTFDYEFEGGVKAWRKPKPDTDARETKESYEKRMIKHRLEMGNWKKKE